MSSPEEALAILANYAGSPNALGLGEARTMYKIALQGIQDSSGEELAALQQQIKSQQTELAERSIRIAELEEQLAEAKKPKRRTTTRSKSAKTNNNSDSG